MVRKIRFALNMPKQNNIRDINTLKRNFNLRCILQYYYNGKLLTWLKDRNYTNYVNKIETFNANNYTNLEEFFYNIFDITDNAMMNTDNIVFCQNELKHFLKDDTKQTIYLCGDIFNIPIKYKNKKYIGINNPKVVFVHLNQIELLGFNISFERVKVPNFFYDN